VGAIESQGFLSTLHL